MKLRNHLSALLYIFLLQLLFSCQEETYTPRSDNRLLMGTVCVISLDKSEPADLFEEAFAILENEEKLMSLQVEDSDLNKVNEAAGKASVEVSDDTLAVLRSAIDYAGRSGGAFDPTIAPLVELWGIVTGHAESPPDPSEIKRIKELTDYTKVKINADKNLVMLEEENMEIDLGAIAKGYAGDRVKEFLLDKGVERGIINLGGNIVVIGSKPGDKPWKIGIQNPFDTRGRHIGLVSVVDSTVVTSGIYERFFIYEDKRYHHILDPETGYPVDNELASVSIISEKSIDADALSTSLFVLGVKDGLELIEQFEGAEAIFVTHEKEVYLSSGANKIFELQNSDFSITSLQ